MLSKFEIAIIVLLVANILVTIYVKYRRQEDYKNNAFRDENNALSSSACNGKSATDICVRTSLQDMYNYNPGRKQEWRNNGGPSNITNSISGQNVLNSPLVFGKGRNTWGMCVNSSCRNECGKGGSYSKCYSCLQKNC